MIRLNGFKINPVKFPDGTSQVTNVENYTSFHNEIFWEFENESELASLLQILDYYENSFITHGFNAKCTLEMPFLPYGRQDKSLSENYFGLQSFMRFLGKFKCLEEIITIDAHSKAGNGYYSKTFVDINPSSYIVKAIAATSPTLYCFPDGGARDRYTKLGIFDHQPVCSFSKKRNSETGHIDSLMFNELVEVEGESILIIDDICDGGMTFKLCAERLLTLGAKEVNLYTTHGIYSKGIQTLKDSGINKIFNRKGEVTELTKNDSIPKPPEGLYKSETENM